MNEELNLKQIIEILLPKWIFILVTTLVVGAAFFFYSSYVTEPIYVAQGTLYISGAADAGQGDKNAELSDLMISQELARTYGQILSSNTFFKTVAEESGTDYTYRQLQRMTTIANVENTGLLQVNVSNIDPYVASRISNTILKCAPEEIERVVVGGSATIIDPAETPKAPSSPNIPKNTIIGALIGFVLAILVVFLQNMFDKSIKSADEIKDIFGLPVLGTVPVIDPHHDENKPKETSQTEAAKKK